MQKDLTESNNWCSTRLIQLNYSKYKLVTITRKYPPLSCQYTINRTTLCTASSYRYPGVHLTNNLSRNLLIETLTEQAYLPWLHRTEFKIRSTSVTNNSLRHLPPSETRRCVSHVDPPPDLYNTRNLKQFKCVPYALSLHCARVR